MPRREELAAQVGRELRAAVAVQRRRSGEFEREPHVAPAHGEQRFRPSPDSESARRHLRWRAARNKTVARWLYPLSRQGGTRDHVWDLGAGRRKRITLKGFETLVRSRRLDATTWWLLAVNHRQIRTGDLVYIYASDDDAGIVGFAIAGPTRAPRQGSAAVQLHVDVRLSGRLVGERPVPATAIRRWLRPHTRRVEDMTAFSQRLDLMLSRFYRHTGYVRRARDRD